MPYPDIEVCHVENDFLVSYCELTVPLTDIDVYSEND